MNMNHPYSQAEQYKIWQSLMKHILHLKNSGKYDEVCWQSLLESEEFRLAKDLWEINREIEEESGEDYVCPKCGERKLKRFKGRRKQNWGHFQCKDCGHAMLAEFDPESLKFGENHST